MPLPNNNPWQTTSVCFLSVMLTLHWPRLHERLRSSCWIPTQPVPAIGPLDTPVLAHDLVATPVAA